MGTHYGADAVECGLDIGAPVTHSLVDSVFKGSCAAFNGNDLCAQQLHAVNVQGLSFGILSAHIHAAFKAHKGAYGSGGNAVLTCACFGNDTLLAHALCKEYLTKNVIYLVSACMVKVLTLDVYFCAAQILGHMLGIVQH